AGTLLALFLSAGLGASRIKPLHLLVPGLVITASGAFLFTASDSLSLLLSGRFLNGLGTGLIVGTATTALYQLAPAGRKARSAVLATLSLTGGAAMGPLMTSAFLSL